MGNYYTWFVKKTEECFSDGKTTLCPGCDQRIIVSHPVTICCHCHYNLDRDELPPPITFIQREDNVGFGNAVGNLGNTMIITGLLLSK